MGHSTTLKGPVEACIYTREVQKHLHVFVVNIDENCLDHLKQSKACVDLGRKLLRVRREDVHLLPEASLAEVVTAEVVCLAPRTETWVHFKPSRTMQGVDSMMEPTENHHLTDGVAVWSYGC